MEISVRNVRKEFDRYPALHDVSLDIASGELLALLGPSGSGKTTLLRLIAGLEFPTEGSIFFGSDDASSKSVQERNVGFVFQHYALFKHMSVADNIGFGLTVRPRASRPPANRSRSTTSTPRTRVSRRPIPSPAGSSSSRCGTTSARPIQTFSTDFDGLSI